VRFFFFFLFITASRTAQQQQKRQKVAITMSFRKRKEILPSIGSLKSWKDNVFNICIGDYGLGCLATVGARVEAAPRELGSTGAGSGAPPALPALPARAAPPIDALRSWMKMPVT
jgi:hypothetical protein